LDRGYVEVQPQNVRRKARRGCSEARLIQRPSAAGLRPSRGPF